MASASASGVCSSSFSFFFNVCATVTGFFLDGFLGVVSFTSSLALVGTAPLTPRQTPCVSQENVRTPEKFDGLRHLPRGNEPVVRHVDMRSLVILVGGI